MTQRGDELKELVRELWEATSPLAGTEVPRGLRERTFERLLENRISYFEGLSPGVLEDANGLIDDGQESATDATLADAAQRADAVADRLRIDSAEAADIFDLGEAEPVLRVHGSKIAKGYKAGQREIALLVCSARTALGLETGSSDIRAAAERYGKLDSNFMTNLASFSELAVRGQPGSSNRQVRLKGNGWEAVWTLVENLTSDER